MKKLVLLLLFVLCLTCVSAAEYQDYIVSVDYGLDVIDYNPGLYQLNRALHFESTELAGVIVEP